MHSHTSQFSRPTCAYHPAPSSPKLSPDSECVFDVNVNVGKVGVGRTSPRFTDSHEVVQRTHEA